MPKIIIHRSAHEIGGNCIEIAADSGQRILLDTGLPLDSTPDVEPAGLPPSLDLSVPILGVLISHPHLDHWGLINRLPENCMIYSGPDSSSLMGITAEITRRPHPGQTSHWMNHEPFQIGPFRVTPLLTDHSAFDSYMLLVEIDGKRILYTGDFRLHGKKGNLVERLIKNPPENVDVLIMEGTNLGSDKPIWSENIVRDKLKEHFLRTKGRVFIAWSAQNIDRTCAIYSAARRAGRNLVIDLYTADVLEHLANHKRIPQPSWKGMEVVITSRLRRTYETLGGGDFVKRLAESPSAISAWKLSDVEIPRVIMVRGSLISDYSAKGVVPTPSDSCVWSMWSGYLHLESNRLVKEWFEKNGCPITRIHTSGHASGEDLRDFAKAIDAACLIPVHGFLWDEPQEGFSKLLRLKDGEPHTL